MSILIKYNDFIQKIGGFQQEPNISIDEVVLRHSIDLIQKLASNEIINIGSIQYKQNKLIKNLVDLIEKHNNELIENDRKSFINETYTAIYEVLKVSNYSVDALITNVLYEFADKLGAAGAVFYAVNETGTPRERELKPAGFFGIDAFDNVTFKFNTKTKYAEGICGQAMLEMKSTYVENIESNLFQIKTGLGSSNSFHLLYLPLVFNDERLGIIEFVFFSKLPEYKKQLIIKIGDSIASALYSIINQEKTTNLLRETQFQAEQLKAQEEEMRQNMEELQTTQEESYSKSLELGKRILALNESEIVSAEFSGEGVLEQMNECLTQTLFQNGIKKNLIGLNISDLFFFDENSFIFDEFLTTLKKKDSIRGEYRIKTGDNEFIYLKGAFSYLSDAKSDKNKILFYGSNITPNKKLLLEAETKQKQIEEIRLKEKERSDYEINSLNEMMNIYMENNMKENMMLKEKIKSLEAVIKENNNNNITNNNN